MFANLFSPRGTIGCLQFFFYSISLFVVLFILGVAITLSGINSAAASAAASSSGGDVATRCLISLLLILFGVLPALYAALNLNAKRYRDIGLAGWPSVVIVGIIFIMMALISQELIQICNFLLFVALCLVPGGVIDGSNQGGNSHQATRARVPEHDVRMPRAPGDRRPLFGEGRS